MNKLSVVIQPHKFLAYGIADNGVVNNNAERNDEEKQNTRKTWYNADIAEYPFTASSALVFCFGMQLCASFLYDKLSL